MADETGKWQDKIDAEKALNYLTGDLGNDSEEEARVSLARLLQKWANAEDHTDKGYLLTMLAILIDPISTWPHSPEPRVMIIRNRRRGKQPLAYVKQVFVAMEMKNAIKAGAKLEEEAVPAIAKRLGISRATVWRIWKENRF